MKTDPTCPLFNERTPGTSRLHTRHSGMCARAQRVFDLSALPPAPSLSSELQSILPEA